MERYCNYFPADVTEWESTIKKVENLPFECIRLLGHGEQCSVHTITPVGGVGSEENESASEEGEVHWTEDYFQMNDVEGTFSEDSEESLSESGSDEWTQLVHQRLTIITPSPMGPVEVVAKRFSALTDDVCYEACHPETKDPLVIESSSHKYVTWMQEYGEPVETTVLAKKVTTTEASYNGFVAESLCHLLITDLVGRGLTPHITMAFRALECRNTGYLVMERISATLEETLESNPNLGAREMAALYFQTLITLHILQTTCRLKHHDLHTDNIFIKQIDNSMEWKGVKMDSATHFSYILHDGTILYLPNTGYIVKIGDFGMSSIDVYGRRLQRLDIGTYTKGTGWGEWSSQLDGNEGYDAQMLMGAPPFEMDSWRCNDNDTRVFMRHLRRVVQGENGKLTRSRLRPKPGNVSTVTPLEVIKSVFVTEPGEIYDFRRPPNDTAGVICLTDLNDLSSTSPVVPSGKGRKRQRRRARVNEEAVAVAAVAAVEAECA